MEFTCLIWFEMTSYSYMLTILCKVFDVVLCFYMLLSMPWLLFALSSLVALFCWNLVAQAYILLELKLFVCGCINQKTLSRTKFHILDFYCMCMDVLRFLCWPIYCFMNHDEIVSLLIQICWSSFLHSLILDLCMQCIVVERQFVSILFVGQAILCSGYIGCNLYNEIVIWLWMTQLYHQAGIQ